MTVSAYRDYLASEEALQHKLEVIGWANLSDTERKMLVKFSLQRRQIAWDNAWQMATLAVDREPGESKETHDMNLALYAETVLTDQGIIPPHWNVTSICEHCGEVSMPPGTPKVVRTCRWCGSPYAEYLAMRRES